MQQTCSSGSVPGSPAAEAGAAGPAASAVSGPSNTDTANSRILRFGLDSLYLSFQGQLSETWADTLDEKKLAAQSKEDRIKAQSQLIVADQTFEVMDSGRRMYRYVLDSGSYYIQLSASTAKTLPMAYCRISSECLTHLGPEQAVQQLRAILSELGALKGEASVSRADLFVDFLYRPGILEFTQDAWVTRADDASAYFHRRRISGWAVGQGGEVSARLYDKTLQIEKSGQDYLKALWHQQGWEPPQPVYRLEFQLRHQALMQLQSGNYAALMERLGGLWLYCTQDWLKLTIPNSQDSTRSRWPLHPLWKDVQAVPWKAGIRPERVYATSDRAPNDEALTRGFVSILSSYMAAKQERDLEKALDALFVMSRDRHDSMAFVSGRGFEEVVGDRARRKAVSYRVKVTPTPQELAQSSNEYLKATGRD